MSSPEYLQYKDSGISWLPSIPAHWDVRPIRGLARPGVGGFIDGDWIEAPFITNDGVRLIQTGNIGIGVYKEQGFRFISEVTFQQLDCTEVEPGDVLICRLAEPVGRACLAPQLDCKMITSVDVCILKTHREVEANFLVFLFSSQQYLGFMEGQCRGGTRDRVSRSFLGSVRVALPPSDEQRIIASFLDQETSKIDALISEQQRLIELLKEKRQAVISHAVTKGLNPDVRMKPSGIEWLGEVPEHWHLYKLKHIARFSGGGTPSRENLNYWNGDIPWVSPKDMKVERIVASEEYITTEGLANSSSRLQPIGQVLLVVRSGILQHTIPVAINDVPVALNQDMKAVNFYSQKCLNVFFMRWVQGLNDLLLLAWAKQGATVESLEQTFIGETVVPLPDLIEQEQIANYINDATAKTDSLMAEADRAIILLQERRTALISAAVTGKIDVRNYASTQKDAA